VVISFTLFVYVMTLVLAFRQQMNLIGISGNQRLFLVSTPTLNLLFSIKRVVNTVAFFTIDKFNRQSFCCMMCSHSILMLP